MWMSQTPKAQVTRRTKLDCLRPDQVTEKRPCYSQTSSNGHLSTMATLLADSPCIDSCLNLTTTATSLQWPFSSVPKVAIVERLNCIIADVLPLIHYFPF